MLEGQGLRLIEPLRELFKDEVRDLGMQLGIPREIVMRHPFPGMLKYFSTLAGKTGICGNGAKFFLASPSTRFTNLCCQTGPGLAIRYFMSSHRVLVFRIANFEIEQNPW